MRRHVASAAMAALLTGVLFLFSPFLSALTTPGRATEKTKRKVFAELCQSVRLCHNAEEADDADEETEGAMKAETAASLSALALRVTGDFNELAKEIQASEPEDEFKRLRGAIGRAIGAIYFEILEPTFQEHPYLIPDDLRNR